MVKKRKISPASSQLQQCLTSQEIQQYCFEKISAKKRNKIFTHLNIQKCRRCIDMYHLVENSNHQDRPEFDLGVEFKLSMIEKMKNQKIDKFPCNIPLRIEKGQIWTISTEIRDINNQVVSKQETGIPVLVFFPGNKTKGLDNYIHVFPLSFDTEFQMEKESCVVKITDELSLLCEIFNEKTILARNLYEFKWIVPDKECEKILKIHEDFINEQEKKRDLQYELWKQKEVEIAELFSLPKVITTNQIRLEQIKKAADSSDFELTDYQFYPLIQMDDWSMTIVQKRDILFLQFICDKPILYSLKIDNQIRKMIEKTKGDFEMELFKINNLPQLVEISIVIKGKELIFKPHFKQN